MQSSFSRLRRPAAGFTLVELLMVIAIIGLLVSILLPSLAAARSHGSRTSCAFSMRGNLQGVLTYAADNQQMIPGVNPMDADNNTLTDYNNTNNFLAGNGVWGCRTPSWTAGYATATNQALGLGVLVDPGYTILDALWCPTTRYDGYTNVRRIDYNFGGVDYQTRTIPPFKEIKEMPESVGGFTSWKRRQYFGEPLQKPWPAKDGFNWDMTSPTATDNNISLNSTMSYRGPESGGVTYNRTTNVLTGSGSYAGLKTTRDGFNRRSLIMDYNDTNHLDLAGVNVAFGDGTVGFWSDPNMWKYFTDFRGVSRGGYWGNMPSATLGVPSFTAAFGAGTACSGTFQTFPFAAADVYLGR